MLFLFVLGRNAKDHKLTTSSIAAHQLHSRSDYPQFRFDRLYIDPSQNGPLLHQSSLHVSTESLLIIVLLI